MVPAASRPYYVCYELVGSIGDLSEEESPAESTVCYLVSLTRAKV